MIFDDCINRLKKNIVVDLFDYYGDSEIDIARHYQGPTKSFLKYEEFNFVGDINEVMYFKNDKDTSYLLIDVSG